MTNKELQEKIIQLESELAKMKKRAEVLSNNDNRAFKPKYAEIYWYITNTGTASKVWWDNNEIDNHRYSVGNCYPTRRLADDTVQMLKLIQKAKESQGEFMPDWEDEEQEKYYLYFENNQMRTGSNFSMNVAPIFGYWKEKEMCKKFIRENREELVWFFTEYKK